MWIDEWYYEYPELEFIERIVSIKLKDEIDIPSSTSDFHYLN